MERDTSGWRSHERYDYYDALTTEGLAWECLRRNSGYREVYRQLDAQSADGAPLSVAQQNRWGLRFRGAARAFGPGTGRLLVAGRGSGCSASHKDPGLSCFRARGAGGGDHVRAW